MTIEAYEYDLSTTQAHGEYVVRFHGGNIGHARAEELHKLTANASQNREQMFKFDPNTPEPFRRYKGEHGQLKQGTKVWCNGYAGAIVRHYDGATYEIRVPGGVVATDQFELTDERILAEPPAKPANAQAATAHTLLQEIMECLPDTQLDDIFGNHIASQIRKIAAAPETAAERDNLQQSLTRLQMAVMHGQRWGQALDENDRLERDATYLRETKDQWVRQCDQAREQVKTLLKACKQAIAIISQPVTQDRQRSIPETGHAYRILRDDVAIAAQQLNKAIANAESEQAK